MRMSLPTVVRGDGDKLFDVGSHPGEGNLVLFLYIDFTVKNREIRCFIALMLDLPAVAALKEIVRDYVTEIEQQASGHVG